MRKLNLVALLALSYMTLFSQVSQTANDQILDYNGPFRPASNIGYYPPFTEVQLADLAAGNPAEGVAGAGIKTLRPVLHESFMERFGYDFFKPTFEHYKTLGLEESTVVVGFPSAEHQDPNFYCDDVQSELFDNLYTPIWDNGENGTPINDENYYALYLYKMVENYKDDIRFWEIWNEPGFDFTRTKGFLPPQEPGNWWTNNPDPCDYKLRAPVFHYVRMLRISYEIIHTFDPDSYVTVSGVGFPSFLDAILRNTDNPNDGSVDSDYPLTGGAYFDVVGYHSYPHFDGTLKVWNPNTGSFDFSRHSDAAMESITSSKNDLQDVLYDYGYDGNTFPEKHWTITEINIPREQISDFVGGDEVQRNFLMKSYVEAERLNILQLHLYQLAEIADSENTDDEFHYMGLYKNLQQNNLYYQELTEGGVGFKTCSDELFGKAYDAQRSSQLQLPAQVDGAAFIDEFNNYTYVLWAKTTIDESEQASANYSFPANLNIGSLTQRNWDYSQNKNETIVSSQNINLSATPIFVREATIDAPSSACTNEVVNFESNATGSLNYDWTFVGGSPSQSINPNPDITYANEGIFEVRLEITDGGGNLVGGQTSEIQILNAPTSSFDAEVSSQVVVFSSTTNSNNVDFEWDFGDGETSTEANPTHVYDAGGSYTVELTVSNFCGSNTFSENIVVVQPNDPAPTTSANDMVTPYDGYFRPASNMGYYGLQWPDEMLANLASGNPRLDIQGAGVKALRPSLPESFLENLGYDFRVQAFEHYQNLGNEDNTLIIGFPSTAHREQVNHCQSNQSELFAGMYEDIWDNGENGTPVNDDNYFALYLYRTATLYKDYVKFWEIWNEPGFDFTNITGFLPPGEPGNWWDNDPDPCDYKLRAPVQYMVRMLRISYEVIKSVDEDALITFSGIGFPSFLDAVLRNTDNPDQGNVTSNFPLQGGAYFDVVGFHSYPNFDGSLRTFDPNISAFRFNRNSDAAANGILDSQAEFQNVLDDYGYDGGTYPEKHWIITEANIPRKEFAGALGGEEVQINYVIKALVKSKIADLLQLHMFKIAEEASIEDATNEFQSMGLYEPLADIDPGEETIIGEGIAFKTASDQLFVTDYDAARTQALNLPTTVDGAAFVDPDGNYTYVLWAKADADLSESATTNYSFPGALNIAELIVKQWDYATSENTTTTNGQNISLTTTPIFLSEVLNAPSLPLALFEADVEEGCFPLTVRYNSFSENGEQLQWSFPGGTPSTSTASNPEVTYINPGEFDAILAVTNDYGESVATETSYIVVNGPPSASFNFFVQDLTVNFDGDFEPGNDVLWNFGNGSTSTGFNPTHIYQSPGVYTVTFTVTNECGPTVITQVISVGSALLTQNTIGCVPLESSFNANVQDPISVLWTFPGGEPFNSTELNPTVTYNDAGVFSVTLEVTTASGTETFTETNIVNTFPLPAPAFEMVLNLPEVRFNNISTLSNSHFWEFGDGATSGTFNPTHDYTTNGEYEVTLTSSNNCGSQSTTQMLSVQELPQAKFTASKTSDCQFFSSYFVDESTYSNGERLWIFEGGTPSTSMEQAIVVSYPNPGLYNVTLIVENEFGTSQETFFNFIAHDEEAPAASFEREVEDLTVTFTNTSPENSEYLWDFGDGTTSTSRNPIHTYQVGGNYTITLQVSNGCGSDEERQVLSTSPGAFFDYTVGPDCLPVVVNFEDQSSGSATSWNWSFPGGTPSTSTAENPTVTYNNPGTFDVTLEVSNFLGSTTHTESNIIVAGAAPDAEFAIFVEGRMVSFTPSDLTADSYFWEFGDGNTSNQVQPVHTYDDLGSYSATLTMSDACGSDDHIESIVLNNAPFPQFSSSSNSGCAPLEVDFIDESSSDVEFWQWSFPGGTPGSSLQANPSVRYDVPGIYPVSLTVFNSNGSNFTMVDSYVEVLASPDLDINTQINGGQVSFTTSDDGLEEYLWDFGDGNTSTEVSPVHTYEFSGSYTIRLTIEAECGSFEFIREITVTIPPQSYFASDVNSACGSLEVQFYDLSTNDVSSWNWAFPGGNPENSTLQNPVVTYTEVGSFPVTLTVENGAGSTSFDIPNYINVYENPVADFDFDIENTDGVALVTFTSTSSGAATYLWDFDEGPWGSDLKDPIHIYPESGSYEVSLTVQNDCGTNTITRTVEIVVVSTQENELNAAVEIFPNPTSGTFILKGSSLNMDELEISLHNILGKEIEKRTLAVFDSKVQEHFDIEHLAVGTYFLKLAADGKQNVYKVVITR